MLNPENQSGFGLPSDLYKMLPILKRQLLGPHVEDCVVLLLGMQSSSDL